MSLQAFVGESPTRRSFLKTVFAAVASLILPKAVERSTSSFWFLHTATGDFWAVDDPVSWCLKNARQPILKRARERLLMPGIGDPQRVIRLVTRRCTLNLIEIQPERVVVHYWGQQGQGDLRPFFKQHALARRNVEVVLIERKREANTVQHGHDFLYGERLGNGFPVELYTDKCRRRIIEETGDEQAAHCSWSNYCWEGVEERCIPWRVLKSAWQHEKAPPCWNCDKPTLLIRFGYFDCGFYKRGPTVIRICPLCRSLFEDHSPWDGPKWMMANLGQTLLPSHEIVFGKPVMLP